MTKHRSIFTDNWDSCYLCGRPATECHHVYGGSNRKFSDSYGLTIPLCHDCHTGDHGIHFDADLRKDIQQAGQILFQNHYPDIDFKSVFGRYYI